VDDHKLILEVIKMLPDRSCDVRRRDRVQLHDVVMLIRDKGTRRNKCRSGHSSRDDEKEERSQLVSKALHYFLMTSNVS
jgi:hypothetical protein